MRVSGVAVTLVNVRAWNGEAWQNLLIDATGKLLVSVGSSEYMGTDQIDMTETAAQIIAGNEVRKSLCIKNIGANDVAISQNGVTFATGFILKPGEALSDIRSIDPIYGICNTGLTSKVCLWEES